MTTHHAIAHDLLADIINNPGATATMADVRRRLLLPPGHPHGFPEGHADAIGQVHRATPDRWPMEQVAAFTYVHAGIVAGDYGAVVLTGAQTKGGPGRDKDREGNASRLAELCAPFSADVDLEQNSAAEDGTLTWSAPIKCDRSAGVSFIDPCPRTAMRRLMMPAPVAPKSVPLEIGSSSPSRTMWHLLEDGAVARWPYGADFLTLLVNFKP